MNPPLVIGCVCKTYAGEVVDAMDNHPPLPPGTFVEVVRLTTTEVDFCPIGSSPIGKYRGYPHRVLVPWVMDKPLVVTGMLPETARDMVALAIRNGWVWNGGRPILGAPLPNVGFGCPPDKTMVHSTERNAGMWGGRWTGAIIMHIANHSQAVKWLLSGGASPIVTTIEQLLPADVLLMLRNNPTNPLMRGLIRAACNIAVPKEVMETGSAAQISDWLIETICPKPPPPPPPGAPGAQPANGNFPPEVAPPDAPPAPEVMPDDIEQPIDEAPLAPAALPPVDVSFISRDEERGRCDFVREVTYRGTLRIPADRLEGCESLQEIRDAIDDFVADRYDDTNLFIRQEEAATILGDYDVIDGQHLETTIADLDTIARRVAEQLGIIPPPATPQPQPPPEPTNGQTIPQAPQ